MSHKCGAIGCEKKVTDGYLMCLWHWRRVPKSIADRVWSTVRVEGKREEYEAAVAAAIAAVAVAENRDPEPAGADARRLFSTAAGIAFWRGAFVTRAEHLRWAKDRALEYVKDGDRN